MSKKIFCFVPENSLNGAEFFLKSFVSEALIRGDEVSVFFLKKRKTELWDDLKGNVKFYYTDSSTEKGGLFKFCYLVLKNSFSKKVDIVISSHFHMNCLVGFLTYLKIFSPKKVIFRESSSWLIRLKNPKLFLFKTFYFLFYRNFDLLITQTESMREELLKQFNFLNKKNVQVLRNPINLKAVQSVNRNQFSGYKTIVAAGRLNPIKGFDILIRAFKEFIKENENYKLIILGKGNEKENLSKEINRLGLQDKVILYGYTSNPYPFFKEASLCVVSSILEGFPNVLHQMMANNANVLSTLCSDGIQNIDGLITCESNSIQSLLIGMQKASTRDNVSKEKSEKLFKLYLQNNSIENYFDKVIDLIN